MADTIIIGIFDFSFSTFCLIGLSFQFHLKWQRLTEPEIAEASKTPCTVLKE